MKAFITGASGFVGSFLTESLLSKGLDVVGIARSKGFVNGQESAEWRCDVLDAGRLEAILRSYRPDYVIHLAAPAFIPASLKAPKPTYEIMFQGTLNLLECVRKLGLDSKILYVSSADVYGDSRKATLTEEDPCKPINPYSSAKACAELMCQQYFHSYGLDAVMARPFNHTGPGQSKDFVCSDFAAQIAGLTEYSEKKLYTGNIDVRRDFLDVRDVAEAYCRLLTDGRSGEIYNISSGYAVSIREIIGLLFNHAGIADYEIVQDPQKVRMHDIAVRAGDSSKLRRDTGWQPRHSLSETIQELLQHWKEQLH
ncbi:GDP-mannose 4,6-dehydratase [Paenibacillus sp. P96]|uniref:GDP-mannose 4,6-dehydratase n=1 Tax=Paenibacillus zeirhizosphaerae TaxID=2987519 RepID=A0ABT9FNF6_9BACL|nr:GDP-mannose 4,6-dehydratase [Paenibacillus sp. P96]MDP4096273.1 GDP-mannose 4,6-dehydratase [Paenibacillus sp. P96]